MGLRVGKLPYGRYVVLNDRGEMWWRGECPNWTASRNYATKFWFKASAIRAAKMANEPVKIVWP